MSDKTPESRIRRAADLFRRAADLLRGIAAGITDNQPALANDILDLRKDILRAVGELVAKNEDTPSPTQTTVAGDWKPEYFPGSTVRVPPDNRPFQAGEAVEASESDMSLSQSTGVPHVDGLPIIDATEDTDIAFDEPVVTKSILDTEDETDVSSIGYK